MKEQLEYFSKVEIATLIRETIRSMRIDTNVEPERIDWQKVAVWLKVMLEFFTQNSKVVDKSCQWNIGKIGANFTSALNDLNAKGTSDNKSLSHAFVCAYRMLYEFEISFPGTIEDPNLREIIDDIDNRLGFFDEFEKQSILFARYRMPIIIFKDIMQSENIQSIIKYNELVASAEIKIEELNSELKSKEGAAKLLSDKLDKYGTAFNFVGLSKGYEGLLEQKKIEKRASRKLLFGLGIIAIAPLCVEILIILLIISINSRLPDTTWLGILVFPTATIELILIYYYRVALHEYKSIMALVVQIELRKTLCEFIQNYSEYSSKIKKENDGALDKFESLIFSGLVTNDENLPSTLDGIEQISKLIKSVKG